MTSRVTPKHSDSHRWPVILLLVILAAAAWLRFAGLGAFSLWLDEGWDAWVARHPVKELIVLIDTHLGGTPVHYLMMHAAFKFHVSDFTARLHSAVTGTLSIVLFFYILRRYLGIYTALAGAYLLSLSPMAIEFSKEARPYSLLLFSTLLQVAAWVWYLEKPGWKRTAGLTVAMSFGLYAHFFGWMITGCLFFSSLVFPAVRKRGVFISSALAFISFTPWLYSQDMIPKTMEWAGFLRVPGMNMQTVRAITNPLLGVSPVSQIFFLILLSAGLYFACRTRRFSLIIATVYACILIFIILWGDYRVKYFFAARQILFLQPVFLAIMAYGFVSVCLRWCRTAGWIRISLLLIFVVAVPALRGREIGEAFYHVRQDFRSAVVYVLDHSGENDFIFAHPLWWAYCVDFYWPENREQQMISGLDLDALNHLTDEDVTGRYLWWVHFHPFTMDVNVYDRDDSVDSLSDFTGGITAGRCKVKIRDVQHLNRLIKQRLTFSVNHTWKDPPQAKHVPGREQADCDIIHHMAAGEKTEGSE